MLWGSIGVVVLLVGGLLTLVVLSRTAPSREGIGELPPCPTSPNCVCSKADPTDDVHYVEPFEWPGNAAEAVERLEAMLVELPNVRLLDREGDYLHAEFATPWLGFRDDVEFLVDAENDVVHVRSASRVGRSDLGANRARVEQLRDLWSNAEP